MNVKNYLRICLAIITAIALWGLVAPICISSEIDLLVVFGILLVLFVPVLLYWILKPIIEIINKQFKNKNNEKNN
jgi:hypothetical protein